MSHVAGMDETRQHSNTPAGRVIGTHTHSAAIGTRPTCLTRMGARPTLTTHTPTHIHTYTHTHTHTHTHTRARAHNIHTKTSNQFSDENHR